MFSHAFPMIFPWFPHGFPMVFPYLRHVWWHRGPHQTWLRRPSIPSRALIVGVFNKSSLVPCESTCLDERVHFRGSVDFYSLVGQFTNFVFFWHLKFVMSLYPQSVLILNQHVLILIEYPYIPILNCSCLGQTNCPFQLFWVSRYQRAHPIYSSQLSQQHLLPATHLISGATCHV